MTGLRRSGFSAGSLSYAEVGASQMPDLFQFAPNGAKTFFDAAKLGTGDDRFAAAVQKLMTWQAFIDAGFAATPVAAPAQAQQNSVFLREAVYGADGTPYLVAGSGAQVQLDSAQRAFTVVRVMQTAEVAGVVLGTADEGDFTGEVSLSVEQRSDGNVWAFARGFWHEHTKKFLGLGASAATEANKVIAAVLQALAPNPQLLSSGQLEEHVLAAAGVSADGSAVKPGALGTAAVQIVNSEEKGVSTQPGLVRTGFATGGGVENSGVAIRSQQKADAADYEEAEEL